MSWAFLLVVPFLGRLKLFYEDTVLRKVTWWMTQGAITCLWADRIYIVGILAAAICIFEKRFRLRKKVAGMETVMFEKSKIYIADINITPFTVGLLKPRIVLPKVMWDSYNRDELKLIILHEQTHIRLGHLWYSFVWDILRCLFWVNPFFLIFQKYFRTDMEDICDRVCIQNSGKTAYEYGMVLLKTLKLLQLGSENITVATAYAGEKDFKEMKRRIVEIANFRPYSKNICMGMIAAVILMTAVSLFVIRNHSYAHYNESKDIIVCKYDGEPSIVSNDTDYLNKLISYDDHYVYVERKSFEEFLYKNNAQGDIYIIFGGYYKFPGLGGAAEGCLYENSTKDEIVRISYESIMDNWLNLLYKYL